MGSSIHTMVNLIMAAKPLDTIVEQPMTKSMDQMMEQVAQMVTPVKTTAGGGLHGSLALVLDDTEYTIVTCCVTTSTDCVNRPPAVHPDINDLISQCKLLHLQAETKQLQKEFNLQEAVTHIGVQCIINSIEEQYIEELNKDYFGYASQNCPHASSHQVMQGYEKGAHGHN